VHAVEQAYLLVLREVHADATAEVQDAAAVRKGWLARALAWVTKATSTIKSSVDEDLHTLPTVAGARLAGTQELVSQFRTRNVNLIKTVAAEHVATVDRIVRENSGTHVTGLTAKLQESLQVSESKAKFWAVDQTLKLHADIVQTQHERLGIEEYDWITSKDGTVRDDHARLEGQRFRYDDPPVTNASEVAKGRPERRRNPGKDYRCRCHADPVLPTLRKAVPTPQTQAQAQQPEQPKAKLQMQTLYRAASEEHIAPGYSFAETVETAQEYLDNPGFGGHSIYKAAVRVDPTKVLDLRGISTTDVARRFGVADPGAIGVDEWIPRPGELLDKLEAGPYQWVKVNESFPEGTTTWIWVGAEKEAPTLAVKTRGKIKVSIPDPAKLRVELAVARKQLAYHAVKSDGISKTLAEGYRKDIERLERILGEAPQPRPVPAPRPAPSAAQQPRPVPARVPQPAPRPQDLFRSIESKSKPETTDRIIAALNPADADIIRANPPAKLIVSEGRVEGKNYQGMYEQTEDIVRIRADHILEEFPSFVGKFRPGKSWSVANAQATAEAAATASLTHELAHRIMHLAKGSEVALEIAKAFANGKGKYITNYAKTNSQEYFAETYSAYRYHPEALRKFDPVGYQMVVNVLQLLGYK
jgi:SPP1 gp7 family putative phage head morphogenesis protein